MLSLARIIMLIAAAAECLQAQPAYVGSASCGRCHASQAAMHGKSGHSRSLSPAAEHPLAGRFEKSPVLRRGEFQWQMSGGKARGIDAANSIDIPVEWAFGAGAQAVTFVSRVDRDWYIEHAYSYYAATDSFGLTPGQHTLSPKTLTEAAGLMYRTNDPASGIRGCFECHSTGGFRDASDGALLPRENGVQCEGCHGPGSQHATQPGRSRLINPGKLSSMGLNDFCGRCHRPPASDPARIDWMYAWNVRHQPVYLSQSACFNKARNKLSCLTCHTAHQPLARSAAFYNAKCGSCHAPAKSCKTNCVDCHMPRISPEPPLQFTNHWIGIYGSGAKLRPLK
jgi:hypothetical protein